MHAELPGTIVLAQINPCVGDIAGNVQSILDAARRAQKEHQAWLTVFPELVLCGYPPRDLLFQPDFRREAMAGLSRLAAAWSGPPIVVGHPHYDGSQIFNAASVITGGRVVARAFKQCLPNYGVFDEKRYFVPGTETAVWNHDGVRIALLVCEDLWAPEPAAGGRALGADLLVGLSASPFCIGKAAEREGVFASRVRETGIPLVCTNLVGGQDEIVFDGISLALNPSSNVVFRAPACATALWPVRVRNRAGAIRLEAPDPEPLPGVAGSVYPALRMAVADYVGKNGITGVLIGLSGGIDSSLTAALAVDALGAGAVTGVLLPSRHTSALSRTGALEESEILGIQTVELPIEPIVKAFRKGLEPSGIPTSSTVVWENLQARIRGVLLMALSNASGRIVLATGNKSEMAMGYTTLYGDMAGGFAPLADVPKTLVFELARYRNAISPVIPRAVLEREPTAELREGQRDRDSLPPYAELDPILEALIETERPFAEMASRLGSSPTVREVVRRVAANEYKRRQAALGVKITSRAFGIERRYPVTSGFDVAAETREDLPEDPGSGA
jgi:NAD+ synthase (glutamine-hydrolysing)